MPGTSEDEAIGGAQAEIQPSPSADGGTKEAPAPKDVEQHLPSGEDLRTLRRVADHIPPKLFTIAFIELCERFSYYGTTIVYTNFIQQALPAGSRTGAGGAHGQSGALGMGQQASTAVTTFNQFWQYFMPLFGAYVADEYLGRFKTISFALLVDMVGHIILVTSALPPVITKASGHSLGAMVVGIIIIGFGTGGFKPNISPLIVEQLKMDQMRVKTLPSGERVIVDPAVTINRVYNWFYLFINLGSLVGQLSMVYAEKYVGFWLSFLLPTCMLCVAPAIMWWGRSRYETRQPAGSVLGKALRTWLLAQKGRWHLNPHTTWRHMNDGTFWTSVKPSRFAPGTKPRWMTFDDAWVDELARGFAACAVFCWYPVFWLTYNQINNNLVSQAAVMRLDGVPNDVLGNLDPIALIILIPICDFLVYPLLRRLKVRLSPLRKITLGFFAGAAAMVWAAVVQARIYAASPCGTRAATGTLPGGAACPPVDISVWAQSGAYVLVALAEVLASITSLEYAFSKAPRNMRSTVQAVALFTAAVAAAAGEALVPLSADPLLVWNYGAMAVLAFVAGCLFWLQFRALDRDEDGLNELPEGTMFAEDEESAGREPVSKNP